MPCLLFAIFFFFFWLFTAKSFIFKHKHNLSKLENDIRWYLNIIIYIDIDTIYIDYYFVIYPIVNIIIN